MNSGPRVTVVGLISDTHGMVRPSVHQALSGVELILHAGDVGGHDVLHELGTIAPVRAVHGNTDPVDDPVLPEFIRLEISGKSVRVVHGHELGSPTHDRIAAAYDEDIVVYGHTHRQLVSKHGEQLIVNPGAAGARRFNLQPSVALLRIADGLAEVEIVGLD